MRLDHLLSKEEVGVVSLLICQEADHDAQGASKKRSEDSGGDALMGDTRTHPEHDG